MNRFTKLTGVHFNDNTMPVLDNLGDSVTNVTGLAGWVNANANNYYTDINGNLALRDKSVEAADFAHPIGQALEPSIVANVLNGFQVVRFAGASGNSDKLKRVVSDVPTGAAAEFSIGCVARRTAFSASTNVFFATAAGATGVVLSIDGDGDQLSFGGSGGLAAFTVPIGQWLIIVASVTGGSDVKLLSPVNLTSVASQTMDHDNSAATLFMGGSDASGGHLTGDIAESIYAETDILDAANAAELAGLISYFQEKYEL